MAFRVRKATSYKACKWVLLGNNFLVYTAAGASSRVPAAQEEPKKKLSKEEAAQQAEELRKRIKAKNQVLSVTAACDYVSYSQCIPWPIEP